MAHECPSDDRLVAHVRDRLDRDLEAHLDSCSTCRRVAAALAREGNTPEVTMSHLAAAMAATEGPGPAIAPGDGLGTRIGRFALIEKVGAGGMAEVWAAYDPVLDRRVALKLLSPRFAHDPNLLIREARAVARLSHPNVVAVHDAGDVDGRVFIAMDYLPGGDLRRHLAAQRRPWREIVGLFLEAGRGLTAAHRAGLVHRDFKPANALLAADGRVVVADFGLAGARGGDAISSLGETLVEQGTPIGTPAYMAPEQHRGEATDARSDQFSFCASLWEALFGQLPFAGETPRDLRASVVAGQRRPAPSGTAVPLRVRRALDRGLAIDPAARHPSLDALLAELDGAARLRRRRWIAAAVVAAVAAGAAVQVAGRGAADPCAGADARWATGIGTGWATAASQAFTATGLPYADRAWSTAHAAVDGYGRRWRDQYVASCRAGQRGEQSAALLDARMRCLDVRLAAAGALTGRLAVAGKADVERAVDAAGALPSIEGCADVVALASRPPPPAAARDAVAALEKKVAAADARRRLMRKGAEQPEEAAALLREATALDYAPVMAAAALGVAKVSIERGEPDAANRTLDALVLGLRGRDDRLVARAAGSLASTLSQESTAYDEARRWGRLAQEAAARLEGDDGERVRVLRVRGRVELDAGDPGQGLPLLEQALALAEKAFGPDDQLTAQIAGDIADGFRLQGDTARAETWAARELAALTAALGARHPYVGFAWFNGAMAAWRDRRFDVAEIRFRSALSIFDEVLEPTSPARLRALAYLGETLVGRQQPANAIATLVPALALADTAPPAFAADIHKAMALALEGVDRLPQALAESERAVAAAEAAYGPDSTDLLVYLRDLLVQRTEVHGEAAAVYQRALALVAAPNAPFSAAQLHLLYGDTLVECKRFAEAVAPLEAVLAGDTAYPDGTDVEARLALAKALALGGGSRVRARALLDAADAAARDRHLDDLAARIATTRAALGLRR